MANQLSGKVAIITGAARNQGRAYSQMLASEGANVMIHYHSASAGEEAEETARLVREQGAEAELFEGDLAQVAVVEDLFQRTIERFGGVDILINNAGVVIKKPMAEMTEEDYDRAFGINAKAAFFTMREAAKHLRDNGRVINMGTTLLGATTGFYGVYAGSKAPLEHFSRALAKEIGDRGITVNVVAPGPLDTSFFYPAETDESVEFLKHMSVSGELGKVEDIVPLVRFLALPEGQWVTAQTMFINGGFVAR